MVNLIDAINWKSWPARLVALFLAGLALGLLWFLMDLPNTHGPVGWLLLAVVGLPLYIIAEGLWDKVFSAKAGREISARSFSWKRIWIGVFLFIGLIATASALSFLANHF